MFKVSPAAVSLTLLRAQRVRVCSLCAATQGKNRLGRERKERLTMCPSSASFITLLYCLHFIHSVQSSIYEMVSFFPVKYFNAKPLFTNILLTTGRSWVRIHNSTRLNSTAWMRHKLLWIKVSDKCINVRSWWYVHKYTSEIYNAVR